MLAQKIVDCGEQRCRLLDVRHVTAILEHHELRGHDSCRLLRRRQRDRILPPVNDQRRCPDRRETAVGIEIEIAETVPYGLLYTRHHAKGREVTRTAWIGEVSGNAQLEVPLS